MRVFPVVLILAVFVGQLFSVGHLLSCTLPPVLGFGYANNGQLGLGSMRYETYDPLPVDTSGVLLGLELTAIAGGGQHSLVLSSSGQVFSFGDNNYGQLGDASWTTRYGPVEIDVSGVLNSTTIKAIAAGGSHSLVLSDGGFVFSFGNNGNGQLGDGTMTARNFPVEVSRAGLLNGVIITAISAGDAFSLVLSDSGNVYSFGANGYGQLGDGSYSSRAFPVAVSASGVLNGTTIKAVSAGSTHSLVLSTTGKVFSFGYNGYGQLGDGTTTSTNFPVAVNSSGVLNGQTITAISAGGQHSLVLSATGNVSSFGYNSYGQLGDTSATPRSNPVSVYSGGALNGQVITAISAGGQHSLVLSASGYVFSFGYNNNGQLGDGSWSTRYVPVTPQLNAYDIIAIDAGSSHSLTLLSILRNVTAGQVRDGLTSGVQQSFQSSTTTMSVNWDAFVAGYSSGRTRILTNYVISTFSLDTGAIVMSPRNYIGGSSQSIFSTSQSTTSWLLHNSSYYTVVIAGDCPEIYQSSPGFLVDTTDPLVGTVHPHTSLWLVGGNFTFEWDNISDPESGIERLRLQFYDATTYNILPQECTVWTSASAGSVNMTWMDCGGPYLPPVTPLMIRVLAYNRAGLSSAMYNSTTFQAAGFRVTDVIRYDGTSSLQFRQCRRAIIEWTSIGIEGTDLILTVEGQSTAVNLTDTPYPVERHRFEWEPVPSTLPPGSNYQLKMVSLYDFNPAPSATINSITVTGDDTCITVVSPDETSHWESGTTQTIKWTSTSITGSLTLELLEDYESIHLIGSTLVAAHKYTWMVPYNMKPDGKFQVRATSLDVTGVVYTTKSVEITVINAGARNAVGSVAALLCTLLATLAIFVAAL